MSGSAMGALATSFAMVITLFLAVVFAVVPLFLPGDWQIAGFVIAAVLSAITLVLLHSLRKYEQRYYAHRAEMERLERTQHPERFAAKEQCRVIMRQLNITGGYGFRSISMEPVVYEFYISVDVADWDEAGPRSVNGVPYDEWLKAAPKEVNGYKLHFQPRRSHQTSKQGR